MLSDAVEASTFGSLTLYRETKFVIGFDFAVTRSSLASSCVLFDIASRLLMQLKLLMLNKHKRWRYSSRVKFPLVNMSASFFLVSMYLILILGSKLILSNNQTLDTCLIVGLLLMIILITASLSSKIFNKVSLREDCMFEEIKSTLSRSSIFPWIFFRVGKLCGSPFLISLRRVSVRNCDDQIPEIKRGFSVNPESCVQGNDFWFCWTVRNWSLFLTHQTV